MKHIIIGYHHALRSFPQQSTYFDVALYLLPFAHKISCTFALFFHERISLHPSGASHRYTIMKKLFVYFLHNCSHPGTYTPIFWQSFQSLIVWLFKCQTPENKPTEKKCADGCLQVAVVVACVLFDNSSNKGCCFFMHFSLHSTSLTKTLKRHGSGGVTTDPK